jgi:hypothetical protein
VDRRTYVSSNSSHGNEDAGRFASRCSDPSNGRQDAGGAVYQKTHGAGFKAGCRPLFAAMPNNAAAGDGEKRLAPELKRWAT